MHPTIKEITQLLDELILGIGDDFRITADPSCDEPGMLVVIATDNNCSEWAYQTGDSSFAGSCYHYEHWALVYLYRDSDTSELAKEAIRDLRDNLPEFEISCRFESDDFQLFTEIWNQGIDSRLEGFRLSTFREHDGRLVLTFADSEIQILLRRLHELAAMQDLAYIWETDILQSHFNLEVI